MTRTISALSILSIPRWRIKTLRLPSTAIWLIGLTLLASTLRLFWIFYTDTVPLGGDPAWYYLVATNLAKGLGFVSPPNQFHGITLTGEPTAFWPPGYPFALAAVFKLFGISITNAKALNAVLGAAAVPFVYALGAAIFDQRSGLAAACLYALFPNAIAWTPVLFPEPLFVFLFIAALWLLIVPLAAPRTWLAIAGFGLLVGLATLTRGEGLILLAVAMVYWLGRSGGRTALRHGAIALVAAAAVIAPWAVRNAVQMHAFIPVSTNSASVLRIGHAPDSTGYTMWTQDTVNGVPMDQSPWRPDWEVAAYKAYPRRAIAYAVTHPKRELELIGLKIYNVYRSDAGMLPWLTTLGTTPLKPAGLEDALWYLLTYSYYVLLFAAIASVPFWLRRDAGRLLLATVFLFWTLFHVIFVGDVRYHVPLFPFFVIAVGGGVSLAIERMCAALGAPAITSSAMHARTRRPGERGMTESPLDAPREPRRRWDIRDPVAGGPPDGQ